MSAISAAMSGIRAATARMDVSAENLVNQNSRGAAPGADAGPALDPAATPIPKVYRPMRASLYSLPQQAGGGVGVQTREADPGYIETYDPQAYFADDQGMVAAPAVDPAAEMLEQIQAAAQYRVSLKVLQTAGQMQDEALDILA